MFSDCTINDSSPSPKNTNLTTQMPVIINTSEHDFIKLSNIVVKKDKVSHLRTVHDRHFNVYAVISHGNGNILEPLMVCKTEKIYSIVMDLCVSQLNGTISREEAKIAWRNVQKLNSAANIGEDAESEDYVD